MEYKYFKAFQIETSLMDEPSQEQSHEEFPVQNS